MLTRYASTTSKTNLAAHVKSVHKTVVPTSTSIQNQRKISDAFFPDPKKRKENNDRDNSQFMFARRLSIWFCRDLLPYNTVNSEGFEDFWQSMRATICKELPSLPSRTTISVNALDDVYMSDQWEIKTAVLETSARCLQSVDIRV